MDGSAVQVAMLKDNSSDSLTIDLGPTPQSEIGWAPLYLVVWWVGWAVSLWLIILVSLMLCFGRTRSVSLLLLLNWTENLNVHNVNICCLIT